MISVAYCQCMPHLTHLDIKSDYLSASLPSFNDLTWSLSLDRKRDLKTVDDYSFKSPFWWWWWWLSSIFCLLVPLISPWSTRAKFYVIVVVFNSSSQLSTLSVMVISCYLSDVAYLCDLFLQCFLSFLSLSYSYCWSNNLKVISYSSGV